MSVGQHVTLVTVDEKAFSGVLNTIDDKIGKVVLKNVKADGCKLPDLQTFYASDIKDLAFLEGFGTRDNSSESLLDHVKRSHGKFVFKRDIPHHLLRAPTFNGDKMLLSHIAGDDDGVDQGIGSGEDGDEDYYDTGDYTLICRPCEKFREVICYLMKQEYVAAMFYGVEIGRKGTLSVLQIATKENFFLFDMLRLGKEGFVDGLQELLESQDVVKIIHDSRMVSDMLYHQYNLVLLNVFDTQVAGAFVFRNRHGGDWPRSIESLPSALLLHLNLSEEDLHIAYVRERSRKMDEQVWLQRPLSKQLLTSTIKNLRYMIPLYHNMCQKLMLPFKVAVDIYLDHVRSAPEGTAEKQRVNSHLLPFAFQDLEKMTASFSKEHSYFHLKDTTYDHKGFCENTIRHGLHHSKVIKSRDSIWHACRKGFPSSRSKNSQPQIIKGIPPEESFASNKKSLLSEPQTVNKSLALKDRSVESTHNDLRVKKKDLLDTSPSSSSHSSLRDSPGAEENSKGFMNSCSDHAPSPRMVHNSSTLNNSSPNISQSALFKLEESPLPALESSESDEKSRSNNSDEEAKNLEYVIPSTHIRDAGHFGNSRNIPHHESKFHSPSLSKGSFKSFSSTEGNYSYSNQQRYSAGTSCWQSKDELNVNSLDISKMNNSCDRSYDEMNIIPAGVHISAIGKKRAKRIQEQLQMDSQRDKPISHVSLDENKLPLNDLEEDLGSIPMHSSLHRWNSQEKTSLNSSGFSVDDLCDVGTSTNNPPSSKSILSSLNLPTCQPVTVPLSGAEDEDADGVEESYIDDIFKLEEVQKILRQTKLEKPSTDIKEKMLSSKIRL